MSEVNAPTILGDKALADKVLSIGVEPKFSCCPTPGAAGENNGENG